MLRETGLITGAVMAGSTAVQGADVVARQGGGAGFPNASRIAGNVGLFGAGVNYLRSAAVCGAPAGCDMSGNL